MTFKSKTFTFGAKDQTGVNNIPINRAGAPYSSNFWPGLSVYNTSVPKVEYLFLYSNAEAAIPDVSDLRWANDDCIMCWNAYYIPGYAPTGTF